MTLTEFLAARLDEDESDARQEWDEFGAVDLPDMVLRQITATRAILVQHGSQSDYPNKCRCCITDRRGYPENWSDDYYPCLTLRLLAAVYSDHRDYDEAWKAEE